ncbi:hypothetical protein T440DRAFT_218797 [Plenodomus tracheiphilus IPT5]|uniref:Uncharacterized protein n=1 Tax=Plenodomus tracheiphilus IPT5 TaxID=1408161 RepID=A0A6A7AV55_9PLEO|nr:hypothetical protein T440DRAFT_218797 [Plenodomus tracheiphilus IPT5]
MGHHSTTCHMLPVTLKQPPPHQHQGHMNNHSNALLILAKAAVPSCTALYPWCSASALLPTLSCAPAQGDPSVQDGSRRRPPMSQTLSPRPPVLSRLPSLSVRPAREVALHGAAFSSPPRPVPSCMACIVSARLLCWLQTYCVSQPEVQAQESKHARTT